MPLLPLLPSEWLSMLPHQSGTGSSFVSKASALMLSQAEQSGIMEGCFNGDGRYVGGRRTEAEEVCDSPMQTGSDQAPVSPRCLIVRLWLLCVWTNAPLEAGRPE